MTFLALAANHLIGVAATSAAVLLAMLILRNPLGPNWLRTEGFAQGVGLVLTAGAFIAILDAVAALSAADVPYSLTAVIVVAVQAGSAEALWKLFGIGDRLAQAEAGQSPFARRQSVAAVIEPMSTAS